MATSRQVEIDGRELKLTNVDKVLYPQSGFTKGEMIDYYSKVAPAMIPHLSSRAVTLRRFPEGV
ncbi:MAG: ATP-dependent DNA ligase, partial [Actinobacteria bacterium]|nr:ATP-dependent DNA ligase [Actinomycetota bacterium]